MQEYANAESRRMQDNDRRREATGDYTDTSQERAPHCHLETYGTPTEGCLKMNDTSSVRTPEKGGKGPFRALLTWTPFHSHSNRSRKIWLPLRPLASTPTCSPNSSRIAKLRQPRQTQVRSLPSVPTACFLFTLSTNVSVTSLYV